MEGGREGGGESEAPPQVAMALTGGPSFLVLDEPSAGMDAQVPCPGPARPGPTGLTRPDPARPSRPGPARWCYSDPARTEPPAPFGAPRCTDPARPGEGRGAAVPPPALSFDAILNFFSRSGMYLYIDIT